MPTIYVENVPYEVPEGRNLLHACLSLGFDLPYFCWHPEMGSVGACRQCAVKQFKDAEDGHGKLVMACMTPATEGTRISIADELARQFRAGVVEGLMMSHPHDCPVCDEGGHCHLQDMTYMTGHDYRRYEFEKRVYRNQYLGPLVSHEMNRCIQCYRCVRFYREYAGGRDLNAFRLRRLVFFGRDKDGVLESEFSGNLVEVCPTGVFTDATVKQHYTRKWDLQMAPSLCVHCGLGCNVTGGERYGSLRRIVNRFNRELNGYFLCDRGRYGYEFVNSPDRVREPSARRDGRAEPLSAEAAVERLGAALGGSPLGVGSPRASLEANFALRQLVGRDRFFAGVSARDQRLAALVLALMRTSPARLASLHEAEQCDAVLVLGEDLPNFAPRMALSLRQSVRQRPMKRTDRLKIPRWLDHAVREAIQEERGPLFVATPGETRIDDVATEAWRAAPDDVARLGFAVAHAVDPSAPAIDGLPDADRELAGRIAAALREAERPLVVSGPGCGSEAVVRAAASVARALAGAGREARIAFTAAESNSVGLALLGARPLAEALPLVREGSDAAVVVLENDLYRRAPGPTVDELFSRAREVVVLDSLRSATTEKASLLLPAGTFAETSGTLVNNEGRAQRFFSVLAPQPPVQESWRWLRDGAAKAGRRDLAGWRSLDDVLAAIASASPDLAEAKDAAPASGFREAGERIPRQPHRYSGRTSMRADVTVHEPKPPEDPDAPLAFSMEGYPAPPPSAVIPFFWAPGWNSIQSTNKFQAEVAGELRGGVPGVRLVAAGGGARADLFREIPARFQPRRGEWLLVPLHHVFGSEELSRHAPAIAQLAPEPRLAMNGEDAAQAGLEAGALVEVSVDGATARLPLSLDGRLPRGVAGVPAGTGALGGADLPAWGRVARA
jgi:NADH-quinone oxidoreductase subunit G